MRINKINKLAVLCLAAASLTGCSDEFLKEKQPYGNFGPEVIYGNYEAAILRLNYLYQKTLPQWNGGGDITDQIPLGMDDDWTKCTEEYPGSSDLINPAKVFDNTTAPKFFYNGVNQSPWKKMREATDIIVRVGESEGMTEKQKKEVIGQAQFIRAWRYFRLAQKYGGLPLIKGLQSAIMADADKLNIPRSTTKETFEFICQDLEDAANNLPARWEEEQVNWGRITSGAALAMKGYVQLYYASPLFNRANDKTRWEAAYETNKRALAKLAEGNFGLAYENNPGKNAEGWAKMFSDYLGSDGTVSEMVFGKLHNNLVEENPVYNDWEHNIRPNNARGGGGKITTDKMVDIFPMADGRRPEDLSEDADYVYDRTLFFLNRDPRFYRTFAFPGVEWQFSGTITGDNAKNVPFVNGSDYELWSLSWFQDANQAIEADKWGRRVDRLSKDGAVYVRKRSDDYGINPKTLYVFNSDTGYRISAAPVMIMRYAEVLLNFAEAACGAGYLDEAYEALLRIRKRAGFTNVEEDYGLNSAIKTDQAKMFEAILYERQIELAYEGKRYDDCRRWMLWDGGAGIAEVQGAPASWALTGFGGNTCTYLGVKPLNGQEKYQIEMYIDPEIWAYKAEDKFDPFNPTDAGAMEKKLTRPNGLTLKENITAAKNPDGTYTCENATVQALVDFYINNKVTRKEHPSVKMDSKFNPKCYLFGLNEGDQRNNPAVMQTITWESFFGGTGTFDPLAE